MKTELTKQYVKKTVKKLFLFVFLCIIFSAVTQSVRPLVYNEIALSQMDNTPESFVIMEIYNRIRPAINLVYGGIIVWFTYSIGRDTYKFVKTIEHETEKEN